MAKVLIKPLIHVASFYSHMFSRISCNSFHLFATWVILCTCNSTLAVVYLQWCTCDGNRCSIEILVTIASLRPIRQLGNLGTHLADCMSNWGTDSYYTCTFQLLILTGNLSKIKSAWLWIARLVLALQFCWCASCILKQSFLFNCPSVKNKDKN